MKLARNFLCETSADLASIDPLTLRSRRAAHTQKEPAHVVLGSAAGTSTLLRLRRKHHAFPTKLRFRKKGLSVPSGFLLCLTSGAMLTQLPNNAAPRPSTRYSFCLPSREIHSRI